MFARAAAELHNKKILMYFFSGFMFGRLVADLHKVAEEASK